MVAVTSSIPFKTYKLEFLLTWNHLFKNLRTRVDLLFGHFLVLRGETRRGAELADLTLVPHPPSEGITPCFSVALTISNGKNNKRGKKQYGAAMRNRDPLLCTMGALGLYFYYRWHCSGENPPSFRKRQDWYRIKLLVAGQTTEQISWQQQYDDINRVFNELGIASDSVTHAPRKKGPQSAEFHGVSESQVSPILLLLFIFE
jgi:Centromere DNA-binding protein complex CBF3 subunit, domain 2